MKCAFYPSPYGLVKIGCEDGKIVCVQCVNTQNISEPTEPNESDEPDEATELSDMAYRQLLEYFDGKRQSFELPVKLSGTEFQTAVWRELQKIPYGETRSYKDIAEAVGRPKAYRAVGMANHNNPIWIIVPCHRVVGADGSMVGYAGGINIKRDLLELEKRYKGYGDCKPC